MRAFQLFCEYDQLDVANLVGLEILLRRCQMIEYHYEKKAKASAAAGNEKGLTRDEAAYFVGSHRLTGEVMICPELVEFVAKEVERDTGVAK
eukprot:1334010-Lingulodinium_polyedra.AAC.1